MVGAQRPHGIPDAVSFHFDRDAFAVILTTEPQDPHGTYLARLGPKANQLDSTSAKTFSSPGAS